jgi:hypothetical protein
VPAVDELLIRIDASTELLRRELKRGTDSLDTFSNRTDRTLGGIDKRFAAFGKTLRTTLGVLGLGLSIRELGGFTKQSIEAANAIAKAARTAGFGAERFQRLKFVFEQSGVGAKEFDLSLQKVNRRLGLFISSGGGPAARALKELGLATDITAGKIRTSEQLFDAFVIALEGVSSKAKQAALASEIFGEDAGPKLVAALGQGKAALDEAAAAVEGIFSDEQVAKAEKLNDAYTRIAQTVGTTLKGAFIDAAAAAAKLLNVDEISGGRAAELPFMIGAVQASISDLENEIATLQQGAGDLGIIDRLFGGSITDRVDELYRLRAELQRLEDEYAKLRPPPTAPTAPPARPGLEEIRVGPQLITGLPQHKYPLGEVGPFAPEHIRLINEARDRMREAAEATDEATTSASRFGESFAAAFESRGIEALLSGDLSNAVRGFIKDIAELIIRLTILKPIAEELEKIFSGKGKDKGEGEGFLGTLLGGIFGGRRASGGPVAPGRAFLVGEQGPELFVPNAAGQILNSARTRGAGGTTIQQVFNVQAGLPPQWAAQLATATDAAAAGAYEAVQSRLRGRR